MTTGLLGSVFVIPALSRDPCPLQCVRGIAVLAGSAVCFDQALNHFSGWLWFTACGTAFRPLQSPHQRVPSFGDTLLISDGGIGSTITPPMFQTTRH